MANQKFTIPSEFQDELRYTELSDIRSDKEILAELARHHPVTSEKNIWAYWHAGINGIPDWCKRNIANWARIHDKSWSIHVLDTVPGSPNNALKFIPADLLPETFVKGTMDGDYVGPHSADFLRGALLYLHGGCFIDVGCLLFRSFDDICWNELADPQSPYQISTPWMYGTLMANHFVAARRGDEFIRRWHQLFLHLWKGRTNYEGLALNPLLAFGLELDFAESAERGFKWEFGADPVLVFGYITQVLAWARLCMLEDSGDGFSSADYAVNNVLWFDSLVENWAAEPVVGFKGQDLFDALATRLDTDPESEEYKLAYKVVWRLLTRSSMQKITHGKNITKDPALGVLWDLEENRNKDCEPGTFGELLRYCSTHFVQTRKGVAQIKVQKPAKTQKKGLLEP